MIEVCERLVAALEQEVEALESIEEPGDVPAALEQLRAGLQAQEDLFAVDTKLLWQYIDNTPGAKQPIVDVLELLAVQFVRMESKNFFGSAELRQILTPQIFGSSDAKPGRKTKREKLHEIDHDE